MQSLTENRESKEHFMGKKLGRELSEQKLFSDLEKASESSIVQQKKAAAENTKAITNGNRKLGNTFFKGPETSDVHYLIQFKSS